MERILVNEMKKAQGDFGGNADYLDDDIDQDVLIGINTRKKKSKKVQNDTLDLSPLKPTRTGIYTDTRVDSKIQG